MSMSGLSDCRELERFLFKGEADVVFRHDSDTMTSGIYRFQPSLPFFGWCRFPLEFQRYRQFPVLSVTSRFNRQSNKGSRVQIPPARPNSNDSKVLGLGIICSSRPFDTYLHIFGL